MITISTVLIIVLLFLMKINSFKNGLLSIESMNEKFNMRLIEGGEKFGTERYFYLVRFSLILPVIFVLFVGGQLIFHQAISLIGIFLVSILFITSITNLFTMNYFLKYKRVLSLKKVINTYLAPIEVLCLISLLLLNF